MWIIQCARACHHAIIAHAPVIALPAAVTTIGAAAALSMVLARPAPKPDLFCGCHQVWVAPAIPMTPATYDQVMGMAGQVALAGIPLADAPGGEVYGTPSTPLLTGATPIAPHPDLVPISDDSPPTNLIPPSASGGPLPPIPLTVTIPVIPTPPNTPVNVPEPASLALLATGLFGLVIVHGGMKVKRIARA